MGLVKISDLRRAPSSAGIRWRVSHRMRTCGRILLIELIQAVYSHRIILLPIAFRRSGLKIHVGEMIQYVNNREGVLLLHQLLTLHLLQFLYHHLHLSTVIICEQTALRQVSQDLLISSSK